MIVTILLLLILLAAFSLIWWGVNRIAVPEPIKTIVLVILGLLALLVIYDLVAGNGLHFNLR
jgi:hypothetical protein